VLAARQEMFVKFGLLNGLGLILGLVALYIIEPRTTPGQTLLMIIVLALVNGLGGVAWRRQPPKE
jgi:hypothetical protein